MNSTELSWAAGFFDGEGNFGSFISKANDRKSGRKRYIVAQIAQVDVRPLERFLRAVGLGSVHGPYIDKRPTHAPIYQWRYSGAIGCQQLTELLWPYLSEPKREQIEAAWEKYHASGLRVRNRKS